MNEEEYKPRAEEMPTFRMEVDYPATKLVYAHMMRWNGLGKIIEAQMKEFFSAENTALIIEQHVKTTIESEVRKIIREEVLSQIYDKQQELRDRTKEVFEKLMNPKPKREKQCKKTAKKSAKS